MCEICSKYLKKAVENVIDIIVSLLVIFSKFLTSNLLAKSYAKFSKKKQYRPVAYENTACMVAARQSNVLLLWRAIQNRTL